MPRRPPEKTTFINPLLVKDLLVSGKELGLLIRWRHLMRLDFLIHAAPDLTVIHHGGFVREVREKQTTLLGIAFVALETMRVEQGARVSSGGNPRSFSKPRFESAPT